MTRQLSLKESIALQRDSLEKMIREPLISLACRCEPVWAQRDLLDATLQEGIRELPYCKFLYAMNTDAHQISSNVAQTGLIAKDFGRNRSQRPYMRHALPTEDLLLSDAYISLRARRPSITAVQVVRTDDQVLGFIGADFDLRDLPLTKELYDEPAHWRQLKGDPAIRSSLFQQTRAESLLDRHFDEGMGVVEELVVDHGVFHVKIHFSSSRATIWLVDDPFRYRLLDFEALIDPDTCLAYPPRPFPKQSMVPEHRIRPILEGFSVLRFADETIYLRSGSLNIFNGMIGLTFSCDGSHYMRFDEFLSKDFTFWFGSNIRLE